MVVTCSVNLEIAEIEAVAEDNEGNVESVSYKRGKKIGIKNGIIFQLFKKFGVQAYVVNLIQLCTALALVSEHPQR
jgi:hypothetical protein